MLCNICGHECADDSPFCPKCGKSFAPKEQETTAAVNSNENVGTPINTEFVNNAEVVETAPKKKSNLVLILGIVAVAINAGLGCLCGCFGYFPGIVCSIIGIVMGAKEKKTYAPDEKNKNTEIGMILCYVALAIVVLRLVITIVSGGLGAVFSILESTNW